MVASGAFGCGNLVALGPEGLAERFSPVTKEEFLPVAGQGLGEHHRHVGEENEGRNVESGVEPEEKELCDEKTAFS